MIEAHDGEEGLSAFTSSRFDLVVLSGMLPRLPSAEVIREIRRKGGAAAPPILLMVSGYKGTNKKADAQRVGAFDILVKPFEDQAFREAVAQALESTDVGARTLKITAADVAAASRLTSEDIFSDVLQDVGGETPQPRGLPSESGFRRRRGGPEDARFALRHPQPDASARHGVPLRVLPRAPARPRRHASSTPRRCLPPAEESAAAEDPGKTGRRAGRARPTPDIDRMIKDTLSGLRVPHPRGTVSRQDPDHFGQYEILEKIASGGMADAFKARRSGVEGFQKIVAIKKILPHLADNEEFIAMFADEAKLAAQLNHPNIVHIYDLGKIEAGGYFIAMEYVDGRDLRAILQTAREVSTPMPVPLAIYVASKIASALDYAHRRRDADGRELARHRAPRRVAAEHPHLLRGRHQALRLRHRQGGLEGLEDPVGRFKGKVQYMSPEQAWGRPIDRRSDLFSLGIVLFEMLTGEALFRGDTDLNLLEKVRAAQAPAPSTLNPEVPKSLDAILARLLAATADDRYANASDLLRDLDSVLYSYTPAPGSADVAIYLHRLQAEEAAAAEASARTAANSAHEAEPPALRSAVKGTPIARRSRLRAKVRGLRRRSPPALPAPPVRLLLRRLRPPEMRPRTAPGIVYGPVRGGRADKKSRTALHLNRRGRRRPRRCGLEDGEAARPPRRPKPPPPATPVCRTPGPTRRRPRRRSHAGADGRVPLDPKAVEAEVQDSSREEEGCKKRSSRPLRPRRRRTRARPAEKPGQSERGSAGGRGRRAAAPAETPATKAIRSGARADGGPPRSPAPSPPRPPRAPHRQRGRSRSEASS